MSLGSEHPGDSMWPWGENADSTQTVPEAKIEQVALDVWHNAT